MGMHGGVGRRTGRKDEVKRPILPILHPASCIGGGPSQRQPSQQQLKQQHRRQTIADQGRLYQTMADHGRPKHSDIRGATSIYDAFIHIYLYLFALIYKFIHIITIYTHLYGFILIYIDLYLFMPFCTYLCLFMHIYTFSYRFILIHIGSQFFLIFLFIHTCLYLFKSRSPSEVFCHLLV